MPPPPVPRGVPCLRQPPAASRDSSNVPATPTFLILRDFITDSPPADPDTLPEDPSPSPRRGARGLPARFRPRAQGRTVERTSAGGESQGAGPPHSPRPPAKRLTQ